MRRPLASASQDNTNHSSDSFGAFLKRSRSQDRRRLSVRQLSEIIGCPEWYLRRLESNQISKIRPDVLLRLISYFGWDTDEVAELFESPHRMKVRSDIAQYESKLRPLGVLATKSMKISSFEGELAYLGLLRALAREQGIEDELSATKSG